MEAIVFEEDIWRRSILGLLSRVTSLLNAERMAGAEPERTSVRNGYSANNEKVCGADNAPP